MAGWLAGWRAGRLIIIIFYVGKVNGLNQIERVHEATCAGPTLLHIHKDLQIILRDMQIILWDKHT